MRIFPPWNGPLALPMTPLAQAVQALRQTVCALQQELKQAAAELQALRHHHQQKVTPLGLEFVELKWGRCRPLRTSLAASFARAGSAT